MLPLCPFSSTCEPPGISRRTHPEGKPCNILFCGSPGVLYGAIEPMTTAKIGSETICFGWQHPTCLHAHAGHCFTSSKEVYVLCKVVWTLKTQRQWQSARQYRLHACCAGYALPRLLWYCIARVHLFNAPHAKEPRISDASFFLFIAFAFSSIVHTPRLIRLTMALHFSSYKPRNSSF